MKSLIWDLRGNPGGLLPAATSVLDRFIDSGVLVSTRGRALDQNNSYSATAHAKYDIPLALLVDEDSASASEIVAGAIHDHKRGTIVGRPTYGKWSVQSIYHMHDGAGLRLTTAKFYSPRGHNLAKIGVKPDVEVSKPELAAAEPKDRAVAKNGSDAGEPDSIQQPQARQPQRRATYKNPALARNAAIFDDPDVRAAIGVLDRQPSGHQALTTGR
jgi:C-terminal peptidase prc